MSADNKFEKDLLEATAPKKPKEKEGEAVNKTVDDLLKSTLSGLGLDSEMRKEMLAGKGEAGKPEPHKAEPPKPPLAEKREPPPARAEAVDIKPQEKPSEVDSLSWLKEPAPKPEPPAKKPAPSIFKPEPLPHKVEPKVSSAKEAYPEFRKKESVFPGTYTETKKKKSKPLVPIIAGALVVAAVAVVFLVMGGKKEQATGIKRAVTTAQRDSRPADLGPTAEVTADSVPASDTVTPPSVKQKPQLSESAAAERPVPVPDKKQAAETSAASDAAGAPLVPLDQTATKVQEIKPTRTQPTTPEPGADAPPAKPKTTLGQLVPVAEADTPPVLVRRVEPDYPPMAIRMKIGGTVTVNALIDETGAVIRTEVQKRSGTPYGFEKASQDAVMKWKYRPAVKDGTYVKVWLPVLVTYSMKS